MTCNSLERYSLPIIKSIAVIICLFVSFTVMPWMVGNVITGTQEDQTMFDLYAFVAGIGACCTLLYPSIGLFVNSRMVENKYYKQINVICVILLWIGGSIFFGFTFGFAVGYDYIHYEGLPCSDIMYRKKNIIFGCLDESQLIACMKCVGKGFSIVTLPLFFLPLLIGLIPLCIKKYRSRCMKRILEVVLDHSEEQEEV